MGRPSLKARKSSTQNCGDGRFGQKRLQRNSVERIVRTLFTPSSFFSTLGYIIDKNNQIATILLRTITSHDARLPGNYRLAEFKNYHFP